MSRKRKRTALICLTLCMLLSISCLVPVRASAETSISKVLATTSYTPVALMEVQFISASTSTEGCYASSITWYDQNYVAVTDYFGTDTYHLEICIEAYEGYVFAEDMTAYLNNSGVDFQRDESGKSVVLYRDYTPAIWQPTVIKDPGAETVTEGGWASFVATATYCSDYSWSFMDPSGRSVSCAEVSSVHPSVSVDGDGSGKIIVRGIPIEMDGWKAVCTFSGPGGSVSSKGALITVNPDPAKATPTPAPTPSPTPTPDAVESPAPTDAAEHEHEFSEAWSKDEKYHWHACECGETQDKASHDFQWTEVRAATAKEPGEDKGVCAVCGAETVREVSNSGDASGFNMSFKTFRTVFLAAMALVAIGVVVLIIQTVRDSRRRRRRRK